MNQKTSTSKKLVIPTSDEHELLQQEDLKWLAEFRNVLSPYWSARVEKHPANEKPVLVLEDARSQNR